MVLSAGRYNSFVLRILSREGDVVEGEITHVGTRESLRFRDPERMIDFVLDHLKADLEQLSEEALEEQPR